MNVPPRGAGTGGGYLKPLLEFGPLVGFFLAFKFYGMLPATGVLIALTLLSLAVNLLRFRRVAVTPLISAVVATIFGGLTLYLHDERFIKMKPTLVFGLLGVTLLGGLLRRKGLLKALMGSAVSLTDEGWRVLSRNYAIFFLCLAAANELLWRHVSSDAWVTYHVPAQLGLTLLFSTTQAFLMPRYQLPDVVETPPPSAPTA